MADSKDELVVGSINGVYGIKGWVKVFSYTSPIEQILAYQPWKLRRGAKHQVLEVEDGKLHGKGVIVLPDGFQTRNDAESLIGFEIVVSRDQLPELKEGDFYWHELEGLTVVNEAEEILGVVSKMIETGANDVLVVVASESSIDDRERLIPLVMDKVVLAVDLTTGIVQVDWAADY